MLMLGTSIPNHDCFKRGFSCLPAFQLNSLQQDVSVSMLRCGAPRPKAHVAAGVALPIGQS